MGGTSGDAGAGMGGAGDGGTGGAPGAECGNNDVETGEECDDDNTMAGDGCSATCEVEDGWECTMDPSVCETTCGDGIEAGDEECDDGNALACGTCSADCSADQASAPATGTITLAEAVDLVDGDFFTLNDGDTSTEFEFDGPPPGDGVGSNRVAIVVDPNGGNPAMQDAVIDAINDHTGFGITAAASGANVSLTNDTPGTDGNQSSGEMVGAAAFAVTAMTGGAAHDCATGNGCQAPADCASGTCTANACN
jgi:cysteine-rich repeat protein